MRVATDGAGLHVSREGTGSPVLFVGGSGSSIPLAFVPLVAQFDVATWDHRGLGRSDSDDRPLTMLDFARDGLAVADALGWERFDVVGVSFGGMVAQHLAALARERVTRLVLCCTSSGGAGGSSYPLHERPDPDVMAAVMDTRPGEAAALLALTANQPPPREPGYARQLEARRGHDAWDLLPSLSVPTLVAAGRYDGIAPLENSERLAGRIPGAQLHVFEGGHAFLFQDPAAWPAVTRFLRTVSP